MVLRRYRNSRRFNRNHLLWTQYDDILQHFGSLSSHNHTV